MFILFDWSPPFATEVGTFESFMSFVQKDTAVVSFCHNSGLSYHLLWMFKMFDWSVCFWSTCGGWRLSPGSVGFEHCLKMTHLWDLRRRGGTPVPLKRWKAQSTRLAKPPVIAQPGITRHCLPLLILPSSPLSVSLPLLSITDLLWIPSALLSAPLPMSCVFLLYFNASLGRMKSGEPDEERFHPVSLAPHKGPVLLALSQSQFSFSKKIHVYLWSWRETCNHSSSLST